MTYFDCQIKGESYITIFHYFFFKKLFVLMTKQHFSVVEEDSSVIEGTSSIIEGTSSIIEETPSVVEGTSLSVEIMSKPSRKFTRSLRKPP